MVVSKVSLVAESTTPDGALPAGSQKQLENPPSFFRALQWSADGTTVFTSSSGNRICTYVLPENLLAPRPGSDHDGGSRHHQLRPQGTLVLPEPTPGFAPAPFYSLQQPDTQVLLTASSDHPIQLHGVFPHAVDWSSVFPSSDSSSAAAKEEDDTVGDPSSSSWPPRWQKQYSQPHARASFFLIQPENEAYLPVSALLWPAPGTHFYAGSKNLIAVFDATRSGGGPVTRILTAKASTASGRLAAAAWGGALGGRMPGTVSALAVPTSQYGDGDGGAGAGQDYYHVDNHGLLAAGTRTRDLGLYDVHRSASCAASWTVAGAAEGLASSNGHKAIKIGGNGIVQVAWSPCARYLLVNERAAHGLLVYDVRGSRRLLACLAPRKGRLSNQRLECDVFPGSTTAPLPTPTPADADASPADDVGIDGAPGGGGGGFEVWAGSVDGTVAVWEGVGSRGGFVEPSWTWRGHGPEAAVGAAKMHPSGTVLATCSGSWRVMGVDEDDDDEGESSDTETSSRGSEMEESEEAQRQPEAENSLEKEEEKEDAEHTEDSTEETKKQDQEEEEMEHHPESSSDEEEDESESESDEDRSDSSDNSMPDAREARWSLPGPRFLVSETSLKLWSIGPTADDHGGSGEGSGAQGEDIVLVVGRTNSQPSGP